jgi:RNA polymerase sigma-70 factor (ECF subfamily)
MYTTIRRDLYHDVQKIFEDVRKAIIPGKVFIAWSIVRVFKRVSPLASDADRIYDIALSEEIDLFSARRSERMRMQRSSDRSLDVAAPVFEVTDLSDEMLMDLVRDQHPEALSILFSRHSKLVYSIALRILHDSGEAEEVVQECFLYVFRKASAFEPSRGSVKVWIVQVAYSRARDRKTHLVRGGFYLRAHIQSGSLDDAQVGEEDIEREVGARLDCDRLRCAFDELTEIQRRTLELYYFDGLDLREISQRLHETFGNVRHHFYRGLERLRKSAIAERLRNHHNAQR